MKAFLVALAIVAMTTTAYSQSLQGAVEGMGRNSESDRPNTGSGRPPEGPRQKPVNEKEYKSSLGKLPDKKFDPWGKVR